MNDKIISEGRETNLLWKIVPNSLFRYPALEEKELNTLHSRSVATNNDFLPKYTVWKGEKKKNFTMEKADKHYLKSGDQG